MQCDIELSSQSSDRNSLYNRKLHQLARFLLMTLDICNAYLKIRHVGSVFDWPYSFPFMRAQSKLEHVGKSRMKLAIT